MVGNSCLSTVDRCCVVGLETRPLDLDLEPECPILDLQVAVLETLTLFRTEAEAWDVLSTTGFLCTLGIFSL